MDKGCAVIQAFMYILKQNVQESFILKAPIESSYPARYVNRFSFKSDVSLIHSYNDLDESLLPLMYIRCVYALVRLCYVSSLSGTVRPFNTGCILSASGCWTVVRPARSCGN